MRVGVALGCVLAVLAAASAGGAAPQAKLVVKLKQEHRSGASGTATLTEGNGGALTVDLKLTVPKKLKAAFFTAHVHNLTCAEYEALTDTGSQQASISDSLKDALRGKSRTVLYTTLASVQDGRHSINVHDPSKSFRTILCGDIPAAATP